MLSAHGVRLIGDAMSNTDRIFATDGFSEEAVKATVRDMPLGEELLYADVLFVNRPVVELTHEEGRRMAVDAEMKAIIACVLNVAITVRTGSPEWSACQGALGSAVAARKILRTAPQ